MKNTIIKHLLLVCIMILSVAARAAADNIFSIGSVEGKPGDIVELQVSLENSDNVSSVQASIPIDTKLIELVDNSAQTTDRTNQHKVSAGVKDGKLNIFVYSLSMGNIAPGKGAIATVKLKLGNEPSDITLSADKVVMTDSNGASISNSSATDGKATILCAKAKYSTLSIDYGRVPIRSQYQQTIQVSNVGNAPLVINKLQFSAAEFSCSETFPLEIAAGASRTITLNYAPVERGAITEEVKFVNNSIYKLNTIKLMAQPFAVNELHIEDTSGIADSTITISLRMNNMDAITGFQFDFNMPEQLEYVDGSFVLSSRKVDHQVGVSIKDRKLHILAFSLRDTPFSGNDGVVATFKVKLKGRYSTYLEASKAVLTANIKGKLTDVLSDKYKGYITIQSPVLSTTSEIDLGRTPITEDAKASFSIRNDGSAPLQIERIVSSSEHLKIGRQLPITIQPWGSTDVEVTFNDIEERNYNEKIQLYTNDPDCRMHNIKVMANRYSPNYITLSGADVEPGDTLRLKIALSNNDVVDGLQFDLNYDRSRFELLDKYEWSERAKGYMATNRDVDKTTKRYFCYSLGGKEIAKGEGNILTLLFAVKKDAEYGAYPINVNNILLSTPGLTNKYSGEGNNVMVNVVEPIRNITIANSELGSVEGAGSYVLGSTITLTATPKDGYRFTSWSDGNTDNPRTITINHDISLSANFIPNSYMLKYMVDGKEYRTDSIAYGTKITPAEKPTKVGYTFSGWSEIPDSMPAHDVTITGSFVTNAYKLTYMVDGKEYKSDSIAYGTKITPAEKPTKVGYTFSGWSEIPDSMPAHDVTITGSFVTNAYKLTYMVDGKEYKSDSIAYGTKITPAEKPTKVGYTFSGWSEIPDSMPAHDVTITGSFVTNAYKLTYMVDGNEYRTDSIAYGTKITPAEKPTKVGYTFSGWSEIPDSMPAHDVTITGSFSINIHKITWKIDGETISETEMEYGEIIVEPEVPIKEGYEFDCWEEYPQTMPDYDITINGRYKVVSAIVHILENRKNSIVYTIQGTLIGKNMTIEEIKRLPRGIYIVNGKIISKK